VTELVGWTVLGGKESTALNQTVSAKGDTIVNAKFGLRFGLGEASEPGALSKADLYVGYGRALTARSGTRTSSGPSCASVLRGTQPATITPAGRIVTQARPRQRGNVPGDVPAWRVGLVWIFRAGVI